MYGIDAQALEPKYVCNRCLQGLWTDDYMYNEKVLCEECYKAIEKPETIIEFIKAYPEKFAEYLDECNLSGISDELNAVISDYREWRDEDYNEWVVR